MALRTDKDIFKDITAYTEIEKQAMHASGAALVLMKDNWIVHEWYSGTHHFAKGARKKEATSPYEWNELSSALPEGSYQILGASDVYVQSFLS